MIPFIIIIPQYREKENEKYAERFFIFYYKHFLLCDLCALCGEKNIMPGNGKIHDKVNYFPTAEVWLENNF